MIHENIVLKSTHIPHVSILYGRSACVYGSEIYPYSNRYDNTDFPVMFNDLNDTIEHVFFFFIVLTPCDLSQLYCYC